MTAYLSAHGISETFDICASTARAIIKEIQHQVDLKRYPPEAVLTGCGTRVREDVLIDFLRYRKALKDEVARKYVPAFRTEVIV